MESYRTELEKIRPDSNDVVMRCNGLGSEHFYGILRLIETFCFKYNTAYVLVLD